MGVERLRAITEQLIENCADPNLPVALVRWGTRPQQQSIEGTLSTIADIADQRKFKPPRNYCDRGGGAAPFAA